MKNLLVSSFKEACGHGSGVGDVEFFRIMHYRFQEAYRLAFDPLSSSLKDGIENKRGRLKEKKQCRLRIVFPRLFPYLKTVIFWLWMGALSTMNEPDPIESGDVAAANEVKNEDV